MLDFLVFFIFVGISYFLGSICSAVVVCNLFKLPDPRTGGSKNPGATNVLRLSGKKYAAIVLLADMMKGFIPVLVAALLGASPMLRGFIALFAVIGHIYPFFFEFKGGKGVATALGAVLGINIILGLTVCLIWFLVAKISHYSSLASIVALSVTPILVLLFPFGGSEFFPLLIITLFIFYTHKSNIQRLRQGEESKILM